MPSRLTACGFGLLSFLGGPVASQTTVFAHVALLSPERSGAIRDQTVIVKGDRIVWVGPADRARTDRDATIIEAQGKFLLPGFADMHVHLAREGDLLTYLANGITTVRNMWGDTTHLAWRKRIAAGRLLGPRIVTAGPIIDGTPPSVPSMLVLLDPAKARSVVVGQHEQGFDFIKVYNSVPKAVYDSIVTVARELRMPVAGHVPFAAGLFGAFVARQASIEHLRGYIAELVPKDAAVQPGASLKSRSVAWNYIERGRIPALVGATKAAGVYNTPTLMVTTELLAPPETWDSLAKRPVLRYLGKGAAGDRAQIPYLKDFSAADFREANRGLDGQRALVKALSDAGAKLLAGTDSYLQGFALQAELLELERAGLSRWAVLRVATRNAAEYFGEARDWGKVATGQRADLQLIDGNPLESLAALEHRGGVMVRGRWLSKRELDVKLDDLARSDEAH